MKRLPVIAHLPPQEVGRRYRNCPDPKEKTRWHLVWLLLRPGEPLSCERAAPLVGLSDVSPAPSSNAGTPTAPTAWPTAAVTTAAEVALTAWSPS
jgi:hypothetical protein